MNTFKSRGFRALPSRIMGRRQLEALHFPHLCALWTQGVLEKLPSGVNPSRLKASDTGNVFVGVFACFYNATPETNQAEVMGRTQADNIFTMDKFILPSGVDVDDMWTLAFLTPGDNYLNLYALQGAPQSVNPGPFHPIGGRLVLGKLLPLPPPGVRIEEAIEAAKRPPVPAL